MSSYLPCDRTRSLAAVCRWSLLLALSIVPLVTAAQPAATGLTSGRPEGVGMSAERLQRINEMVQRYIDNKQIAGAVTAVARRGRVVHFGAHGLMDLESKRPMRPDTLFRLASTTKPVTGVAIMVLMEEGKLRLNDPVSRFLPEFKEAKVAVKEAADAELRLVPASRPITVRDLLTHTSGLASGGAGSAEAEKVFQSRTDTETLAGLIPRLGAVPLDFHPGSQWRYSGLAGIDILGRIVEVASGQPFDQFLRQRIFEPLGMKDTFFVVPDDRQARLATLYRRTPQGLETMSNFGWLESKTYFSGAGGLVSTAEDLLRFAQMLLNGGQLNGKRILSPRTVELFSTNHVGEMFVGQLGRPAGMGFGFTVEVVEDAVRAGSRRSNGSYGWDGAFGTHFWVDPKEQLVGVFMVQTSGRQIHHDFENAVMQAIIE